MNVRSLSKPDTTTDASLRAIAAQREQARKAPIAHLQAQLRSYRIAASDEHENTTVDRDHVARCIEAAVTGPQKGVLEFGDYGPGCTSLPTELLEALNSAANGENTPISTVILPPGLTTMPPWLNALPIKHLVVPKFAGEYLDLGSQLPSGARIELDAPLKANIKVFVCDPETIQVEIRPQSTGLMDIQNKV